MPRHAPRRAWQRKFYTQTAGIIWANLVFAPSSLAADIQAAYRVGATNGYRNRHRGRAKWLGKTTNEPVEEIGKFVTQ